MQIQFDKKHEMTALTRNGYTKCVGVDLWPHYQTKPHVLRIAPINARGVGQAYLDVPMEHLDDLIAGLQQLKKKYDEAVEAEIQG